MGRWLIIMLVTLGFTRLSNHTTIHSPVHGWENLKEIRSPVEAAPFPFFHNILFAVGVDATHGMHVSIHMTGDWWLATGKGRAFGRVTQRRQWFTNKCSRALYPGARQHTSDSNSTLSLAGYSTTNQPTTWKNPAKKANTTSTRTRNIE